ncbi:YlzJ-like family protein [Bacillus sp. S/N-304-OC-R1]|uniref:YlzJ-like family protein n=1 Tax=Bacillus sp. S/N-304-OC-R1 TaxID=2758034 RepID=UPI001C8E0A4C|nr:YlzJ-like family protein [Bacillus sp. S/N-304-OC-R1]MBY0120635.1 YlzJ-like family protein [Bacillus sp. S/N-304-OC-R1]
MILYTMMPQELVYQTNESDYAKQKLVSFQGIPVLVNMDDSQTCTVIRIMSSDPAHYLHESCFPGAKITLS